MTLKSKTIIKNKFWIVEDDGNKVGTVVVNYNGVTLINKDKEKEHFSSWRALATKYNITAEKNKKKGDPTYSVHNYPCDALPSNILWDVQLKVPIFTKNVKSKSFFGAGYYTIKFPAGWARAYCPKLITLQRYQFQGPFASVNDLQVANRIRVVGS